MAHIENNQCAAISEEVYRKHRAQKRAVKEAIDEQFGPHGLVWVSPSATSSVDGGVQVNLLDDTTLSTVDKKQSVMERLKTLDLVPDPDVDDGDSNSGALADRTNDSRNVKQWPTLANYGLAATRKEAKSLEDLMAFSEASFILDKDEDEDNAMDAWGSAAATARPASSEGSGDSTNSSLRHVKWDLDRFYNAAISKYICPCDKTFSTSQDLQNHLLSGVHSAGIAR